jgi:ribonuclease R
MVGDSVAVEIQKVDALRHQIDLAVIQPEDGEPGDPDTGESDDAFGGDDRRDGPESEDD